MKRFTKILYVLMCAAIFSVAAVNAQDSKWMIVESDDGEFSVEVPKTFEFFYDKNGFTVSDGIAEYGLNEVCIFNSFHDKTLISFDRYKVSKPKKILDILIESEAGNNKVSNGRRGDLAFKDVVFKEKDKYLIRRYLISKNHVYVLTAAAKNADGESATMKRFLDSVKISDPEHKNASSEPAKLPKVSFSALKFVPLIVIGDVNMKSGRNKKFSTQDEPLKKKNEPGVEKLTIAFKPRSHYTNAARVNGEKGFIEMEMNFTENGGITKIVIDNQLGHGLLRQALFSALRMKFFPEQKDDTPRTSIKKVVWSFDIY